MLQTKPVLNDEIRLAAWTRGMQRSVLRDMISVVSRPGILSFAGGLPAPDLFPTEGYARALAHVLATDARALQYSPPFQPLKAHIVRLMARRGVACREEQVFLTTGAQQGLDVLARLLLDPGGQVMLEETVYSGVQQVIAPFQPEVLTVGTDLCSGLDVGAVERLLEGGARPAFLYTIPDAHNPLGVSLSMEKRVRLVELARRYRVPLIEDDPYGFLCYERRPDPPLRALDESWVFYLGSFSKILAPALRVGWIVAPAALIPKLTVIKEASDLESSALTQRAISAFLDEGLLPDHIATLCRAYGARRDAMLAALHRHFPTEARWTEPSGGMFIWVELPREIDTARLLQRAIEEEQVAFIPGHAFAVGGHERAKNCLRLNFSNATVEQIEEGIARLGRVTCSERAAPVGATIKETSLV